MGRTRIVEIHHYESLFHFPFFRLYQAKFSGRMKNDRKIVYVK